jgi:SRSO17 transposase
MNRREIERLECELGNYLDSMLAGMGRVERRAAMRGYVTGLLLDGERKSIEPIAGRLVDDASEIQGMRQRLQQAVTVAEWSDAEIFRRVAIKVDRELPGIEAFVIDDTGFPKKGQCSVGVKRQYSGTLGRTDNCQVAVSLHLAGEAGSACIDMRLFLPEDWAADADRRRATKVPASIDHQPKWKIAIEQIDSALAAGIRRHIVLADAGYGDCSEFREALDERRLQYVVGTNGRPVVWAPDSCPRLTDGAGRDGRRAYHDPKSPPIAIKELASTLTYRKFTWREGSRGWQSGRFAAARIRTAKDHQNGCLPGEEQWLLCQWFDGDDAPTKFWLSTLPADTSVRTLVRLAKLRWRVERDYQELKQEIGLDHFEGRTWRGFHHHVALCAVAHAFLALRRALFPPEETEADAGGGAPPPPARADSVARGLSAL